jgi:hypothetical protein
MRTKTFKAPSGAQIKFTEIGFGTAPIGNLLRTVSEEDAQATLAAAWKAGMRNFDTAPLRDAAQSFSAREAARPIYRLDQGRPLAAGLTGERAARHRQVLRYSFAPRDL